MDASLKPRKIEVFRTRLRLKELKGFDFMGRPRQMQYLLTKWHVENYRGWGSYRNPPTFPYPLPTPPPSETVLLMNKYLDRSSHG